MDNFRNALLILRYILNNNNIDFWVDWINEDIRVWESEKSVKHHLEAYERGEYSIQNISFDCINDEGIWEDDVFRLTMEFAHSLAKGEKLESIIENFENRKHHISGWQCRNCKKTQLNQQNIDYFVSRFFVSKFFLEYLNQDKLEEIISVNRFINSVEVEKKRKEIKALILASNIPFSEVNDWFYTCPHCQSENVWMNQWEINQNELIGPLKK